MNDSGHPDGIPGSHRVAGRLYAAQSSRCESAVLALDTSGALTLKMAAEEPTLFFQTASTTLDAAQIRWQDRIGNIPLRLHLPDGSLFETSDFAAADRLRRNLRKFLSHQRSNPPQPSGHLLHRMESQRWRYLLGLFLLALGLTGSALYWGLPWVADKSVRFVPLAWEQAIGAGVMSTLDHTAMDKTQLSEARQADIRAAFDSLLAKQPPPDFDFRLHFRSSNLLGANALALPGGHVIVTDDLVELADNMDEIAGVLAHELGHVHHRHGMRNLARASSFSFVLLLTLGDATSLINDLAASGAFFMQLSYSRTFEYEADRHAVTLMHAAGREPLALAHMLERLEAHHRPKQAAADDAAPSADSLPRWLSTHPPTPERVRIIRAQATVLGVNP